ncbi:MAG TPA: hypothetical protein VGO14_04040 [Solirubrobacteraceae bacterium]|nr:hypothetical protein [Solirubrobacteraceae bacterium]
MPVVHDLSQLRYPRSHRTGAEEARTKVEQGLGIDTVGRRYGTASNERDDTAARRVDRDALKGEGLSGHAVASDALGEF